MNINRRFIAGMCAILSPLMMASSNEVTPYFSIRTQSLNTPRHIAGLVQQVYAVENDTLHGTLAATLEYSRSFKNGSITNCLFGTQCAPQVTVSGSQVANRGANDWLAEYFYLPSDFKSTLSFDPRIDNLTAELMFYIGLDNWAPGLYFTVYAPLVHTRWDLNFCETVDLYGTNSLAPGYFSPNSIQRGALLNNVTEYMNGGLVGPVVQTFAGTTYTTTLQKLQNALMVTQEKNQTRLADMRVAVGYNFARLDRFQSGVTIQLAAPIGNRPEGQFFFEPVAGNGHHWEMGAGLTLSGRPYISTDEEKQIIIYSEAQMTHMFAARQKRTFDLTGRPFSRYMLIEQVGTPVVDNLQGNGTAVSAQYQNEVLPVANLSNIHVDVSSAIQAEVTASITFVCDKFSWDIGYNLWYRSCESMKLFGNNPFSSGSLWALKGDAQVFGYDLGAAGTGPLVGAVALSATENEATIHSGTNLVAGVSPNAALLNPGIDNKQNATGDATGGTNSNPLSAVPYTGDLTIQTSQSPVFLTADDINICQETTTRGLSNKAFTHFNYTWQPRAHWTPYVGIGGEVEFAHNTSPNGSSSSCSTCLNCAVSQWGMWFKGGITF